MNREFFSRIYPSILDSPSSIFDLQFSILYPRFSILLLVMPMRVATTVLAVAED